ncbi:hypothetical protein Xekj_03903 [Xenorhabdus sp. KJ12.1]|nr:hypothetical protein Xekj_03900 [Xenorhabdus sp. KJ12.1]PHM67359.1 hypothetical protein Xekj_03903 [Xenorhabdus sp. KJ12.1]
MTLGTHHHFVFQGIDDSAIQRLRHGIAAFRIDGGLHGFLFQRGQPLFLALAEKLSKRGFVLAHCLAVVAAACRTFQPRQLLFQRGFQGIQLRQFAVQGIHLLGQLPFLSLNGLDPLIVLQFKLIETLLNFLRNLLYIFDFNRHQTLRLVKM